MGLLAPRAPTPLPESPASSGAAQWAEDSEGLLVPVKAAVLSSTVIAAPAPQACCRPARYQCGTGTGRVDSQLDDNLQDQFTGPATGRRRWSPSRTRGDERRRSRPPWSPTAGPVVRLRGPEAW